MLIPLLGIRVDLEATLFGDLLLTRQVDLLQAGGAASCCKDSSLRPATALWCFWGWIPWGRQPVVCRCVP